MKKPVATIRDVAKAAGVSTATVSKFINGTQRFSSIVEARLSAAISELSYRSNPQARSMITGRTRTVGLAVLDVSNPHFASVVRGANHVAQSKGYTVLLVDTEENPDREQGLLEALSGRVDGMVVYSRARESEMRWMAELTKPLVFFGRLPTLPIPVVASDDRQGGYMLARHLVGQGHRRIAYLGFSKSLRDEERMGGVRTCLLEHGIELAVFDAPAPSAVDGERACARIMFSNPAPDAVVCYNDLLAMGFMKVAQQLGFRVPLDVSVAGFDNIHFGQYTCPSLTSVDLHSEQMGAAAMQKLIAAIDGQDVESETIIPADLVVRASTASRNIE